MNQHSICYRTHGSVNDKQIVIDVQHGGWIDPTPLTGGGLVTVIPTIDDSTQKRKLCECGNLCEVRRIRKDGSKSLRPRCVGCRLRRAGRNHSHRARSGTKEKLSREANKCVICGWVGPCDLHRIIHGKDGGKYTAKNICIICPNCHRLEHNNLLNKELIPASTSHSHIFKETL